MRLRRRNTTVSQLRDVYGDRLEDPRFVLEATLALAVREHPSAGSGSDG